MLKVGLIGFGAIGKDVLRYVERGMVPNVTIASILLRDVDKHRHHTIQKEILTDDEDTFFRNGLDVVIECAGHDAVYQYAVKSLNLGSHFIPVSIGAFADNDLLEQVKEAAMNSGRKLVMPSAAIGGLDRIAASSLYALDEVTLVTSKPPEAWRGTIAEEIVDLNHLTEAALIFEGPARQSAKLFPESTNVSAALSLAGIGFDETTVKVMVDPAIKHNTHQVIAKGHFGELNMTLQNTPSSDNPKSGYIVAMSICKVLNNLTSPIIIGV